MIGRLRRLWHSRDWMLIPLGLLVILSVGWWLLDRQRSPDDDGPAYRTDWAVAKGDASRGPTIGMALSPAGFGTVTSAPPVLAPMAPEHSRATGEGGVAADVAPFVRAWPRDVRISWPGDGLMVCTAEGPPSYSGKLVLIDGCLRFQREGAAAPGPLVVLRGVSLARDADNYLAVGAPDAPAEYQLRVGEPDGVFAGVGCSMDGPVPAPPELARQCGVGDMIRPGIVKRRPVCSAAYLERRRELQRQERETLARLRRDRQACIARTGKEAGCPPDVIPSNMELFNPPCRMPAGADQASHGSSRQPKPSR